MLQEGERTVKVGEIEISCKDRSEALLSMKDLMMAQNAQWFLGNGLSREDGVTHGKTQRLELFLRRYGSEVAARDHSHAGFGVMAPLKGKTAQAPDLVFGRYGFRPQTGFGAVIGGR